MHAFQASPDYVYLSTNEGGCLVTGDVLPMVELYDSYHSHLIWEGVLLLAGRYALRKKYFSFPHEIVQPHLCYIDESTTLTSDKTVNSCRT